MYLTGDSQDLFWGEMIGMEYGHTVKSFDLVLPARFHLEAFGMSCNYLRGLTLHGP
jgi:hypothetical protein